jgi:cytochrome c-type biogenesis protein CcmF
VFLVIFLSLFGLGGIGLILLRLKSLRVDKNETSSLLSRESALFVGAISLCAAALVIAVGTSWPIFAKGTVDPAFYNKMNLPLAILIGAINGFSILLKWKHSEENEFLKSLIIPVGLTVVTTLFLIIVGMRDVLIGVFAASSLFAFFINAEMAYRVFIRNRVKIGPYVAHVGIMVLFLGVIGSSRYSEEVNVSLPLNESREALGYTLTYKGATPIPGDENKFHFNVVIEKDGKAFLLQPVMFYSDYNDGVMKNPDYATLPTKDVYLSPMALEVPEKFSKEDVAEIKKGEQKDVKGMKIKFIDFDRSKFDREAMQQGKQNVMGAELEVTIDGKTEKLVAEQILTAESKDYVPVQLENSDRYTFYLENVNVAGESSIGLAVVDNTVHRHVESPETFVLTASIKPFINFVWLGTGVMVLGFLFSIISRYRKVKSDSEMPSGQTARAHKHSHNGNPKTNGLPAKTPQLRSFSKHK